MFCYDILGQKTSFKPIETRNSKSRKIDIFSIPNPNSKDLPSKEEFSVNLHKKSLKKIKF